MTLIKSPELAAIDKQWMIARRDFLIENIFVSEFIKDEYCDEDDKYCIMVIEAFNRTYYSLHSNYVDTPNRVWVNADGMIFAGSGQNDPFLPQLDGNRWYCGDEIEHIGNWTEEDTQNYNMPQKYDPATGKSTKIFSHNNMMCIPKVERIGVSDVTAKIIRQAYFSNVDQNDE